MGFICSPRLAPRTVAANAGTVLGEKSGSRQFRNQALAAIDLREALGDSRRRYGNGAIELRIEEIISTQRMDISVEDRADHLTLGVDQGRAGIAADDVVVRRH